MKGALGDAGAANGLELLNAKTLREVARPFRSTGTTSPDRCGHDQSLGLVMVFRMNGGVMKCTSLISLPWLSARPRIE